MSNSEPIVEPIVEATASKDTLIDECVAMHELMTRHVLNAGIGKKKWEQLVSSLKRRSDERIKMIHSFLCRLKSTEWRNIYITWTLPNASEEMWEMYHNGFDDVSFPEMVRLKKEQRELRDIWSVFKDKYQKLLTAERAVNVYPDEPEESL